jgi:4-amino-4-deoxy-L-arabinose transferase
MRRSSVIIIALFFLLYVVPLGVRPMVIPDEFRYAEISREMLETGDWGVPHLDGLRYFEKPVLGYWLNAIAIAMLGENTFAVRFFSAVAAGISALFVFFLARRYAGGYFAGVFAAAAFLTCLEVFAVGTFGALDSMFCMFLTAAMTLFFFAHTQGRPWAELTAENAETAEEKLVPSEVEESAGELLARLSGGQTPRPGSGQVSASSAHSAARNKQACLLVLSGISCSLAFLTKGFLAFAVPAVTIIPFLIWQRRAKEIFRILWVPLVTAALVGLPWCLMIYVRENDFWHYFLWTEHIQRLISPKGGQHPEPFWFFIPCILGGALPWTALLPPVISGLRDTRLSSRGAGSLKDPLVRFAVCWFLFPFLLFSASRGKLSTYILPCFPPLAVLVSTGLLKYFAAGKRKAFTVAVHILSVIVAALVIFLILSQTMSAAFRLYEQRETWKVVLVTTAFLTYALFLLCASRAANFRKKLAYFAIGPTVFMFCAQFVMPNQFKDGKAPGEFLRQNWHRVCPDTTLVSDNYLASAVCWCYKRRDVFLLGRGGELAYGLGYDDSKQRLLDIERLRELITDPAIYCGANRLTPPSLWRGSPGKGCITLIIRTKLYAEYGGLLPKPVFEDVGHGFVFAEFAAAVAAESTSLPAQKAQQHAAAEKLTEPKPKDTKSKDSRGSSSKEDNASRTPIAGTLCRTKDSNG